MKENKMPGIVENSVVARVLPQNSAFYPPPGPTDITKGKSEFLDDDVRSLVGEVYEGI